MKKTAVLVLAITIILVNTSIAAIAESAVRGRVKTAQGADALLAMMPETDGIISINVAQLNRQIQSILASKPETAAELQKQFDQIVADTGLDIRSIDSLVAGLSIGSGKQAPAPLILVSGSFNQDQVLASISRKSGRKWKTTRHNGQKIYTEVSKRKTAKTVSGSSVTFFDNQTLGVGSLASLRQSIDARAGVRPGALQNSSLMAAFHQAEAAGSIHFAFNMPEQLRQRLGDANGNGSFLKPLAAITQIIGNVDLNDSGLLANISLVTGSDSEAADVVNLINGGLSLVRMALGGKPEAGNLLNVLNGVTNTQAGNVANLTVNVPADLIRSLLDQIKSKAPKV
jgi:hypothetical protein